MLPNIGNRDFTTFVLLRKALNVIFSRPKERGKAFWKCILSFYMVLFLQCRLGGILLTGILYS